MKRLFWLLFGIFLATRVGAQSNAPVRLALVVETSRASVASDLLTAELSKNPQVTLLERNEIERVYREQGLSAGNKDYLKLGQVIGADGLCLLDLTSTAGRTNLTVRLIAVKPGVVLASENFAWPMGDVTDWAASTAIHLNPFFPKLRVLVKEAIPLSVVNFRSALASREASESEQQLKLLAIQRLSHEPQFFVLERQKMQSLEDEKALKGVDDSAFWSGSYLLEGVVDQNGYSRTTMTIDARLTPPKGGAPLVFQVAGNRTNLTEIVNLLAVKISDLLKANKGVKEWSAADEAQQFFDEGKWALRWGVMREAQMSSDSAWALGKQDLDCAILRMKSYLPEVTSSLYDFETSSIFIDTGFNVAETIQKEEDDIRKRRAGVVFNIQDNTLKYVALEKTPEPEAINRALKTLTLYEDLSHILASQLNSTNSIATSPEWIKWGVADLTAATKVLEEFQFVPGSEQPVAEKLSELRAQARLVDQLISAAGKERDVMDCEVKWGCFWQETPEEGLALYKDLLSSPTFCLVHENFWVRPIQQPRIVGWNEKDRRRIPEIWSGFVRELNGSTNLLWRMEARAVAFADAPTRSEQGKAFTNLFNLIIENRDELMANSFPLFKNEWGLDHLFEDGPFFSLYSSSYRPQLESIEQDRSVSNNPLMGEHVLFPRQIKYLETNTTYNFSELGKLFYFARGYTKAQARELQPLIITYKSNLFARSQISSSEYIKLLNSMDVVGKAENDISRVLDPSVPLWSSRNLPPQPGTTAAAKPQAIVQTSEEIHKPPRVALTANAEPAVETNIIAVNKFFELPLAGAEPGSQIKILTHHLFHEKLLLDFESPSFQPEPVMDNSGNVKAYKTATGIAVFDPANGKWKTVMCPRVESGNENKFYYRSAMLNEDLYHSDDGKLRKFDARTGEWEVLPISNGQNYELFTVADRLYAANETTIFEIINSGKETRLLASTRRNPPVTLLDKQSIGLPLLAEGPNHALRAIGKDKIYSLANNDWVEDGPAPQQSLNPQLLPSGILFRDESGGNSRSDSLIYIASEAQSPELVMYQKAAVSKIFRSFDNDHFNRNTPLAPTTRWKKPQGMALVKLPAAMRNSDLYLLADHSQAQQILGGDDRDSDRLLQMRKIFPRDGYNAQLLCFSRDSAEPQTVLLKFNSEDGCPPATGIDQKLRPPFPRTPPVWMLFGSKFLILGVEKVEGTLSPEDNAIGTGYKTGIWLVPLSQIDSEIAIQRKLQLTQKSFAQKSRQDLLDEYDKDHNGIIEGDEKEEALGDWSFIESELSTIDANGNYKLDPKELLYFDANKNGILDANEEAAIYAVQELLAQKLLEEIDDDQDGKVDQYEFFAMLGRFDSYAFQSFKNAVAKSEAERLEIFLRRELKNMLGSPPAQGQRFVPPPPTFKERVEIFWTKQKNPQTAKKP